MSATAAVTRRDLLQAALLLGSAPLASALGRRTGGVSDLVGEPDLAVARRVGERCRAAGVAADEAALLAGYAGRSRQDLAAFLAGKVREDFTADRLVAVGPWWLAQTECRVLALF